MKFLAGLFLLVISCAAFGQRICLAPVNGTTECSFYRIVPAGSPVENRVLYADLVPSGENRPIRITHGFMNSPDQAYGGAHVLLIESPAKTQWWKTPLAWTDAYGTRDRSAFNPGITLSPTDALCLQNYSSYGVSYSIHYFIGP